MNLFSSLRPTRLRETPTSIKVTDWFFWPRAEQLPSGELWFESDLGPSSVYIQHMLYGGSDLFSFSHDIGGLESVEVDTEAKLMIGVGSLLEVAKLVKAPRLTPTGVLPFYFCPLCGGTHQAGHSTCYGIPGELAGARSVPKVLIGEQLDLDQFDSGQLIIRFSETLQSEGDKE